MIGRDGVEGLSHRRVAETAGVPLSAARYYFSSIENLLLCAMREAAIQDLTAMRDRFESDPPDRETLPALLTQHLMEQMTLHRTRQAAIVELFVAALRRPRLRIVAEQWNGTLLDLIEPIVGPEAAATVIHVLFGSIQHMLLSGPPEDTRELACTLRFAVGLAPTTEA